MEGVDVGLDRNVTAAMSGNSITKDVSTSGTLMFNAAEMDYGMFENHSSSTELSCLYINGCMNKAVSIYNSESYIETLTRISCSL